MSGDRIEFINQYCMSETNIRTITIKSDEISNFNFLFQQVKKATRDTTDYLLLDNFEELNKLFRDLKSSLIPFKETINRFDQSGLTNFFNRFRQIVSNKKMNDYLIELHQLIGKLIKYDIENPIMSEVKRLTSDDSIVVSYQPADYISSLNLDFRHYRPNELMNSNVIFNKVIFLGSPNYYRQFKDIFMGKNIYYLVYDFYSHSFAYDNYLDKNVTFSGVHKKLSVKHENLNTLPKNIYDEMNDISKEDIRETMIIDQVIDQVESHEDTSVDDIIHFAKVFRLSNNKFAFIPLKSSIRILSFPHGKIKLKKASEIKQGEYMIIKRSSDRMFLKKESQKNLGKETYNKHQIMIKKFKNKVKSAVESHGKIVSFRDELKEKGITISSDAVIQYWLSEDSIGPRKPEPLLEYFGVEEEEAKNIIDSIKSIRTAHISAGHKLTERTQRAIDEEDVNDIMREIMKRNTFELNILEVGVFDIYKIKDIGTETVSINQSDIYNIFEIEEGDIYGQSRTKRN